MAPKTWRRSRGTHKYGPVLVECMKLHDMYDMYVCVGMICIVAISAQAATPYCATIIVVLKPFHIAQSNVGLL